MESAALRDIILRVAEKNPLTIAQYMELALQHPEYGYYRHSDPLGADGDFVTAPEISQMFGETIALWCLKTWRQMGEPPEFILCELGPGRGTMMADIMRLSVQAEGFRKACRVILVESNASLRERQDKALVEHHPRWVDHLSALPELPAIILANEFFDALPVRQFIHHETGWSEIRVGVQDGALAWVMGRPAPSAAMLLSETQRKLPVGAIAEISPQAQDVMRQAAAHIAEHSGAVLAIDYGYETPGGNPTFQALEKHRAADPLGDPGHADLTAHVDFSALAAIAAQAGLRPWPLLEQGEFLRRLGLAQRREQLGEQATPEQKQDIAAAYHRLTAPEAMGTLFKVFCAVSDAKITPAGWE
ncbi:MAG: SAM-dependent methyltransferase [Alphaproteobacteria bacterium]